MQVARGAGYLSASLLPIQTLCTRPAFPKGVMGALPGGSDMKRMGPMKPDGSRNEWCWQARFIIGRNTHSKGVPFTTQRRYDITVLFTQASEDTRTNDK
jgi:hypothetical protein